MNKKQVIVALVIGITILMVSLFCSVALTKGDNTEIYVAKGKYWDYYHIKFTLTPENTFLTLKSYYKYGPSEYKFEEDDNYGGGCFQVFIPKDKFPISAPNCKEYIILRMPWTEKDKVAKDAYLKYIDEKRVIFNRIKAMKESGKGEVEVIIQLNESNAGIKIKSKNPLMLELGGCNVWFRDAHGRYIDYFGAIK